MILSAINKDCAFFNCSKSSEQPSNLHYTMLKIVWIIGVEIDVNHVLTYYKCSLVDSWKFYKVNGIKSLGKKCGFVE